MLQVAVTLAMRASCAKRQVGCVLVDNNCRIIGTGYNGKARGLRNCDVQPCAQPTCEGVHAEINALLNAPADKVCVAYLTCFPCWHCVKALLNTACWQIVVPKPNPMDVDQMRAYGLWLSAGCQVSAV